MSQTLFGSNATPSLPLLDQNFTQLYDLRELFTTPAYAAATPKVYLDANGTFMVNTSAAPSSNINGAAFIPYVGGIQAQFAHNTGAASGDSYVGFLRNAITVGSITQVSSIGVAFNTTSDRRLKENFRPFEYDASHVLRGSLPCSYDWKATGEAGHGYIAQQLQRYFPSAVTKGAGRGKHARPWQVDASRMVPVLHVRLVELEDEIAALRAELKGALKRLALVVEA